MKKILIASTLALALSACGNSEPPIYESGMSKKEYGEKFGDWLGTKFASSNEATTEKYREKSIEIVNSFRKTAKTVNSSEDAIKLVDNLISELVELTQNNFNLSRENWIFISDPKVDDSASKQSQLEIKYGIDQIIGMLNLGYLPTTVSDVISDALQDKENGDVYYKVLKDSKYPKIIANDSWLKSYEEKKDILDLAIKRANSDRLYFDVNIEQISDDRWELKSLETEYGKYFDTFFVRRAVKNLPATIYEFEQEFNSKNASDFYLSSTESLKASEDELQRAIENNYNGDAINYARENVEYEKSQIVKINKEADQKYLETKEKLSEVLAKAEKLKNNENLNKVQHNIKVFLKTYQELENKGYDAQVIGKYLSNGRQVYEAKKYDISQNVKLDRIDGMAFNDYMSTMQNILHTNI